MDPDFAQRRRVFLAAAVTVVAVPAAFLLGRGGADGDTTPTTLVSPIVSAAGPGATVEASTAAAGAIAGSPHGGTIDQVLGTTPTGYLGGTVAPDANDTPMIRVPRPRDAVYGSATFSESIDRTTSCIIPQVPMGTEVTITNLDNSRSVKCQVVAVAAAQLADVSMHVEAFARIADITEAPVPVEITW